MIYLASPYSHPDKNVMEERYKAAQKVTAQLMHLGHVVFSPIVYGHHLAKDCSLPTDWEYWKKTLEVMVPRFDELWVITIDGYQESKGVLAEFKIAKKHNLKIKYIDISGRKDIVHRPKLTSAGDPAHGCEMCDGDDVCTCPHKERRAVCLGCGFSWPECKDEVIFL